MNALVVENLHADYGTVPILLGLNFRLRTKESLVVLGRNGVGKTTLLRVLIGLLKPTSGLITLNGKDISGLSPHVIARLGIGYVPQGRGIVHKLSVEENLLIGTRAQGKGSVRIPEQVFTYFPILRERLRQRGGTLSGGEQQMLAIARALCGQPKVLLLDEPSEGIQPSIVTRLGELLPEIVDEVGASLLLVEQNLDLALNIGHRCLVMEKGKIVYEGRPKEFRDKSLQRRYLAL